MAPDLGASWCRQRTQFQTRRKAHVRQRAAGRAASGPVASRECGQWVRDRTKRPCHHRRVHGVIGEGDRGRRSPQELGVEHVAARSALARDREQTGVEGTDLNTISHPLVIEWKIQSLSDPDLEHLRPLAAATTSRLYFCSWCCCVTRSRIGGENPAGRRTSGVASVAID